MLKRRLTSMSVNFVIFGAGGHARVVQEVSTFLADYTFKGFIDNSSKPPHKCKSIIGTDADLPTLIKTLELTHFIVGVGSIKGGTKLRETLFSIGRTTQLTPLSLIHPTAYVSPTAMIGSGVVVMPGAIINTGAIIGDNCIINTGAIIDHDCLIGAHTHIAPGARLSGHVTVGRNSLIGVGSSCIQGVTLGENTTAGAGSVVTKNVAAGTTVVGVPAYSLSRQ